MINWEKFFVNAINDEAIEKLIEDAQNGDPQAIKLIEAIMNIK